jgi:hypothetical protein
VADTGFGRNPPTGEGLFAFETPEQVLAGIETINSDYKRQSRAAREMAREHFDARVVLSKMLDEMRRSCVMGLRIICSGYLIRYPLGGMTWHHFQYLVGFQRLGHEVTYFEDHGWPNSCYDLARNEMTADPGYGIAYLKDLIEAHGLGEHWCYLAEDGRAYGMTRDELRQRFRESDLYVNLSNINWIPEARLCRRRVLVDTDPVFPQIGGHGLGGPFDQYHALFTYGENVHRRGCAMPTAGAHWMPTRQPLVTDLWPVTDGDEGAPLKTVMNWSAYGEREFEGRTYGQKDREFAPFFELPRETGTPMEIAINAPTAVRQRLADGGWRQADPREVTRTPEIYQDYLRSSRAEFSVAKHAYVCTRSGWFSDRSAGYLAAGRPVIVQDTGFCDFLPCGTGLLAFRNHHEAVTAIHRLNDDYEAHCRAARQIAEEFFDANQVLDALLARSL